MGNKSWIFHLEFVFKAILDETSISIKTTSENFFPQVKIVNITSENKNFI